MGAGVGRERALLALLAARKRGPGIINHNGPWQGSRRQRPAGRKELGLGLRPSPPAGGTERNVARGEEALQSTC